MNPIFLEDPAITIPPAPPLPPAPNPPAGGSISTVAVGTEGTSPGEQPAPARDTRYVTVFTVTDGEMVYPEPHEPSIPSTAGDSRTTSPDSGTHTPGGNLKDVSSQTSLSIPPESESASASDISARGVSFSASAMKKDKRRPKDDRKSRDHERKHRNTKHHGEQTLIEEVNEIESSSSGIGSSRDTPSSRLTDEGKAGRRAANGRARSAGTDHHGHHHDKSDHRGHKKPGAKDHHHKAQSPIEVDEPDRKRDNRGKKGKAKGAPGSSRQHHNKQEYPRPADVVLTDKKYPELIDRTVAAHRRKRACKMTVLLLVLFIVAAGTIFVAVWFTVIRDNKKEKDKDTETVTDSP